MARGWGCSSRDRRARDKRPAESAEPESETPELTPTDAEEPKRGGSAGWTAAAAGLLVTLLGLGLAAAWGSSNETKVQEVSPPLEPERAARPPCAAEGAPFEPDSGVRSVCRTIRSGSYLEAEELWLELYDAREQSAKTRADFLKLASDTAVIGRTFLAELPSTEGRPEASRLLASMIVTHAASADKDLEFALTLETTEDTSAAVSMVESIIGSLTDYSAGSRHSTVPSSFETP